MSILAAAGTCGRSVDAIASREGKAPPMVRLSVRALVLRVSSGYNNNHRGILAKLHMCRAVSREKGSAPFESCPPLLNPLLELLPGLVEREQTRLAATLDELIGFSNELDVGDPR